MTHLSSAVRSSQLCSHPRLKYAVSRHLSSPWRQPLHAPTVAAFERLLAMPGFRPEAGLVFDSGCGTGASSGMIAELHPEDLVIGIDRSASRLARLGSDAFPVQRRNAIWIQAELSTFWRLARLQGWRLRHHYLLYPNPWPKPRQLLRRWHAHPVFPDMLALGGVLEMRCNWAIYAREFQEAVLWTCPGAETWLEAASFEQEWGEIETPFGRKYSASGHTLYRVRATGLGT